MPTATTFTRVEASDDQDVIGTIHVTMPMELRAKADEQSGLLALARARAADPTIFDDHPPVFFEVKASDRTIDAFSTRMMDSTLQNYAADATRGDGVPFLDSHLTTGMGRILARSIQGDYVEGKTDKATRTNVVFYMQPSLLPVMQEFHDRARGGYAKDVSVGFNGGRMMCSICGNEMMRWWRVADESKRCYHMPGVEYSQKDESGTATGRVQKAIGLIEDAHLGEVSTVYAGANENAGFIGLKARQMAEAGVLTPRVRSLIEARYDIVLPGTGRAWPGMDIDERARRTAQEDPMPKGDTDALTNVRSGDDKAPDAEELRKRAEQAIRTAVEAEWRSAVTGSLALAGVTVPQGESFVEAIASVCRELVDLRPIADDGKKWRATLVTEALAQGVAAFGDAWPQERQKARLERMSPEDIELETHSWQAIADKALPAGRATVDGDGAPKPQPKTPAATEPTAPLPTAAYASRRRVGR